LETVVVTRDHELRFSKSLTALLPYSRGYARKLLVARHQYQPLYEDIVQTAMLKACENCHSFVSGTNVKAWILAIFRNTIISHRRRYWREVVSDGAADPYQSDGAADPARSLGLKEAFERIHLLTPEQEELLTDIAWHGHSYEEAAKARIATGTVKSRLSQARQLLAKLGEKDGIRYGHSPRMSNRAPRPTPSAA
jgi:RNA polymerase sigma-70 factor (ECF subfamily)